MKVILILSLFACFLCPAKDQVLKELAALENSKPSGTVDDAKKMMQTALDLQKNNKYDEADKLFKKALLIFNYRLGNNNLYSAACFHYLGILAGIRKQVVNASWYMEKCKDIYVAVKGNDNLETAHAWSNMGFAYLRRRRVKVHKALEAFQEALRIWKQHYGEKNIQVARTYADISQAYIRLNKAEKARTACLKALEICKQLNSETPATAVVYYLCSSYYIFTGKQERAAELIEQAIQIQAKQNISEDPVLLMFKRSLKRLKVKPNKLEMY